MFVRISQCGVSMPIVPVQSKTPAVAPMYRVLTGVGMNKFYNAPFILIVLVVLARCVLSVELVKYSPCTGTEALYRSYGP